MVNNFAKLNNYKESGLINLKSDNENLLSVEEKKIIERLDSLANRSKEDERLEKKFYNLSLKELLNNFLKSWNEIIIELISIYKKEYKNSIKKKKNKEYWWMRIKQILKKSMYIITKGDRLIYVGIMLIIISFFLYFLLISS